MSMSRYPNGIDELILRDIQHLDFPVRKVYYVGNNLNTSSTADKIIGERTASDDSPGDFHRPWSTITGNASKLRPGDVVLVRSGNTYDIAAATSMASFAGVALVGCGVGEYRPNITFSTATAAALTVSGANMLIKNFIFKCNIASQAHMIDLKAGGVRIDNCSFREGSATGLSFITADTADGDSDRCKISNCDFYAPTAGNYDNAIQLAKDFVGFEIENCNIYGDFDDAPIHIPTAGNAQVNMRIRNLKATNLQAAKAAVTIVGGNTGSIEDSILKGALASTYGGLDVYNVKTSNESPSGYIEGLGYKVTKSHNLATDNIDLFTVTGKCAIRLLTGEVTTVIGDAATYAMRVKTTTEPIFAATTIDTDAAGTMYLFGGDPTVVLNNAGTPVTRVGFVDGAGPVSPLVVGLTGGSLTIESDLDAADTGVIRWDLFYLPLEDGASIVAA